MPEHIITAEQGRNLAMAILTKAGAIERSARIVADHLTESDLMGVGSHGLIRLARYTEQIRSNHIDPGAEVTVIEERGGLIRLDGGGGFGIVALLEATRRAVAKAKETAIAAATLVNCGHTGRVGAYAEEAARAGCFAMILGGGANRKLPAVAPYGGRKGLYDTNPFAFGLPGGYDTPVVADFATSVIPQGKVLLHRNARIPVPEGCLLDSDGNPTCDPDAFYDGGALLPAGGHKGYGLAVMAELLGDAVLGEPHEYNWLIVALDLWGIRPQKEYRNSAGRLIEIIKRCPPAPGFEEVMHPGEPEHRLHRDRSRNGIPLPESTWEVLQDTAKSLGLSLSSVVY